MSKLNNNSDYNDSIVKNKSDISSRQLMQPGNQEIRLNKFLSECGICSRREADNYIIAGRIKVNGNIALPGQKVTVSDEVTLDGKRVSSINKKVVLAYYKPKGVTCTEKDSHAEKKISDMIYYPVRVTYAGRLDKDSEGLLLLTNDGDLIDRMMRGSNGHEKEYIVRVNKEITDDFIKKMSEGIYLPEVDIKTKPCYVEKIGSRTFKIILTQGVNRQIKRMAKELKFYVNSIKRVRVVNIELADLKPNEYREISGVELQALYNSVYH